jgi:hypothetical protein
MADLTGQTPAATYKGLLQVNDYTDGIAGNTGSSALVIQDGAGNATALAISTDNVGIGTTSPLAPLEVVNTVNGDVPLVIYNNDTTAASSAHTASIDFKFARTGSGAIRKTGAKIVAGKEVEWDSTAASQDGYLELHTTNAGTSNPAVRIDSSGNVTPGTDDVQDFGSASLRWDDIYATNTTIQSSDRELKQDIEELTEAETRVAQACKGLLRKYRWKSSVEEKGDEARIHFGIIAQDLEAAFAAEGLDAGRYGMFVKNTWWTADRVIPAVEAMEAVEAVYDEEGNIVSHAVEAVEAQPEKTVTDIFNNSEDAPAGATEVTQRGVRYSELLAFIIAAI